MNATAAPVPHATTPTSSAVGRPNVRLLAGGDRRAGTSLPGLRVAAGPRGRLQGMLRLKGEGSSRAHAPRPKCTVVAYETTAGGWRFEPSSGCNDLRSTDWGTKGEFEWCPTLAIAMPDEVFWPGRSHRD